MYIEADNRMIEQGITTEDVNKELSKHNISQNVINYNHANFIQPPAQVDNFSGSSPIIQAMPFQQSPQVERIESQKENYKRQKVTEEADFTSGSLMVPISKNLSKISTIAIQEDN